jgi:hypothetical protein
MDRDSQIEYPHDPTHVEIYKEAIAVGGHSNYITASELHKSYLIIVNKDLEETSPYQVRRIHKDQVLDQINDIDYIDYKKVFPLGRI